LFIVYKLLIIIYVFLLNLNSQDKVSSSNSYEYYR